MKKYATVILCLFLWENLSANKLSSNDSLNTLINIGNRVEIFEDKTASLSLSQILLSNKDFKKSDSENLNFKMSHSAFWIRFSFIKTNTPIFLEIGYPRLDSISLYTQTKNDWTILNYGDDYKIQNTDYHTRFFLFPLEFNKDTSTYYIRIKSESPLEIPLAVGSINSFYKRDVSENIFNGIYFGFIIVMMLYNLFIYFVIKDRAYIYYVIYVGLFGISQAFVNGYTKMFLPAGFAAFMDNHPTVTPAIMLFAVLIFTKSFLKTRQFVPKMDIGLNFFFIVFGTNLILDLAGNTFIAYQIVQLGALANSCFLYIVAISIYNKGYKPARFYIIGWTAFLTGIVLYVLKDIGVLPLNFITRNLMQIGSALEVTLLSFALADRINIYKKEKEEAQTSLLEIALKNQQIIQEQNIVLENKVEERTSALRLEKEKSDNLLRNILPEEIAEELKEKGSSEAKQYDQVSVLFTDFVDFTGVSENLSPTKLVAEIDFYFKAFDKIIEKNGLEKIKTIGDAYLAVGGLPNENSQHAKNVISSAKEIISLVKELKAKGRMFDIRIGISSGSVVAGIVGTKKFAYDIWGDTVNTAARMEQNCEPGKINISGSTYQYIKDIFNCEYRGKINAKNKGEIDMYFVI